MAKLYVYLVHVVLLSMLIYGHANTCNYRENFCETCRGPDDLGHVDQAITSTQAAPEKNVVSMALGRLKDSIQRKLNNLTAVHNSVGGNCDNGMAPVPPQSSLREYIRYLFRTVSLIAVKTRYADCKQDSVDRAGDYADVRGNFDLVLCALLRSDRTLSQDLRLCSPRVCPQLVKGRTNKIEFERCTLLASSRIMSELMESWGRCISEEDESYICLVRRRSRRHNRGKKGGRRSGRGRRRGRRGRKGLKKQRRVNRKRCMKKTGRMRRRCMRRMKRKRMQSVV